MRKGMLLGPVVVIVLLLSMAGLASAQGPGRGRRSGAELAPTVEVGPGSGGDAGDQAKPLSAWPHLPKGAGTSLREVGTMRMRLP